MKFLTVFLCALAFFSLSVSASCCRDCLKSRPKGGAKAEIEDETSNGLKKALEGKSPEEIYKNLLEGANFEALKKRFSAEDKFEIQQKLEKFMDPVMMKHFGVSTRTEALDKLDQLSEEEKLKLFKQVLGNLLFGQKE